MQGDSMSVSQRSLTVAGLEVRGPKVVQQAGPVHA